MSKYIKLKFELVEYAEDGNTVLKRVEMYGSTSDQYRGFHNFQIQGSANEREVTLLCQLTTILSALAEEIKQGK